MEAVSAPKRLDSNVLQLWPAQQHVPAVTPPTSAPQNRKYFRYRMTRLQTHANHVLFYVIDANSVGTLAVVGTDARMTGHFIYASLPFFSREGGTPLRCTNRHQVHEWLAALGAMEPAAAQDVHVPNISGEQLDMLLNFDPMWTRPKLDRDYTEWREECGELEDGRHWKSYYLIETESGAEKHIIYAEDSRHRRDRRYYYKAVPELGGFDFENGGAVKEWLDLVVGKTSAALNPRKAPRKGKGQQGEPTDAAAQELPFQQLDSLAAAQLCNGAEVVQALQSNEPLLKWVTDVPGAEAVSRGESVSRALLAGHNGSADDSSTQEALQTLHALEREEPPPSLRLLDASKIAWAVSCCKNHANADVASAAHRVTEKQLSLAAAVLGCAKRA